MYAEDVSGCVQAASPDGEAIVTGAGDETLRFWNVFSKTRCTKVRLKSYIWTCSSCWISPLPLSHALSSVSRNPNQCWTCSPGYANSQPESNPSNHVNEWKPWTPSVLCPCINSRPSDRARPQHFLHSHFSTPQISVKMSEGSLFVKIQSVLLIIVHCGCPNRCAIV